MDENITLEDMRQQINLLKEKLDKENIVNDKLLRASMRQRLGVIRRNQTIEYICALYVISFGSVYFRLIGCSWWFVGGTVVFMIGCMIMNYLMHKEFNKQNLYNDDLLSVAKTMRQLKQRYFDYLYVSAALGLLWFLWLLYEFYSLMDHEQFIFMAVACAVGLTIGLTIGIAMLIKNRRACDDIISQIEQ